MSELTKLGKFQIRRELGKGAMGVVYEGHDPMIDRIVALKTIRAENLQGEDAQEQLARFRREAQAAGRLTHPNIVGIYDFGEDAGTYYIAMEFVKGRELQSYLEANERFTEILAPHPDVAERFFGENAADFLGLRPGGRNRERLGNFYRDRLGLAEADFPGWWNKT